MPILIRVASRFALLSRNVRMRIGTRKWPPMMFNKNQASNKARTWGGVVLSVCFRGMSTFCVISEEWIAYYLEVSMHHPF
jgi:hypothetical protein